jgi:peptidase E
LTGAREPRVCLLPTASGDGEGQIRQFYATFGDRPCEPSHIAVFRLGRHPVPLAETLLAQDLVYVGGGSMLGLLAVWGALHLDEVLRECWRRGVVLAGLSAGAMCWFEWGISTAHGEPAPAEGLGLLPGSLSVHADGEPARLPVYREAVRSGAIPPGWAADDGVGLVFRGERLAEVVSSRPGARALRVTPDGELPLVPRALRGPDAPPHPSPSIAEFRRVRALRPGAGGRARPAPRRR